MSILLSGDYHAKKAFHLINQFSKSNLKTRFSEDFIKKVKYQIILGDRGFLSSGDLKIDISNYRLLDCRPFPVLSVISNYNPVIYRQKLTEEDIGIGEKVLVVNKEKPLIAYLKPGKVYTIDGIKILALGGALPLENEKQNTNDLWQENKYWTESKKSDFFKFLETDNTFDLVLSHIGLHQKEDFSVNGHNIPKNDKHYTPISSDKIDCFNFEVFNKINFSGWFCGHFNFNAFDLNDFKKHSFQYIPMACQIIEKKDDGMYLYNELCYIKEKVFRMQ